MAKTIHDRRARRLHAMQILRVASRIRATHTQAKNLRKYFAENVSFKEKSKK